MYRGLAVVVIAPVYNEVDKIGEVVRRTPTDLVDEVLVVRFSVMCACVLPVCLHFADHVACQPLGDAERAEFDRFSRRVRWDEQAVGGKRLQFEQ